MLLAVAATKGGVGKSTLALQIAIERARSGRDVWLIDADAQATAQLAIAQRAADGLTPPIACAPYPDAAILREQIRLQAPKFEDVILDVGGRDTAALRAALVLADVVLTPFAPTSVEVWGLDDMTRMVREAADVRAAVGIAPLRALAVINQAASRGGDNDEAAAVVEPPLQLLDVRIGRRKSIGESSGAGRSVNEAARRDPKAIAEIADLIKQVFNT